MSEHSHSAYEVGAAEDTHRHYAEEIDGAAKQEDVRALSARVEELTRQVEHLQAHFSAEHELSGAVRGGAFTIPAIAAALRQRADHLTQERTAHIPPDELLCRALRDLASDIEGA